MSELKRQRLQTLARGLSGKNTLAVMLGEDCSHVKSDQIIYVSDHNGEIIPGIPATKGECLLEQKANCAHEAAHIRFTDLGAWKEAVRQGISMVVNILEDARVNAAISDIYPGARDWLRFANSYYLVKGTWKTVGGIFCVYALTGKVPKSASPEARALMKRCRPFIDRAVKAASTRELLEIAREVAKILGEHQNEVPDMPPPRGTYAPQTRVAISSSHAEDQGSDSGFDESDENTEHDAGGQEPNFESDSKDEPGKQGSEEPSEDPGEDTQGKAEGHGESGNDEPGVPETPEKSDDTGSVGFLSASPEENSPEECGSGSSSEKADENEPEEATNLDEFAQLVDQANAEADALEKGQKTAGGSPPPPDVDPKEIARGLSGVNRDVPFEIYKGNIPIDRYYGSVKNLVHSAAREIRESLIYKTRTPERNLRKGTLHSGSLWKLSIPDLRVFCKIRQTSSTPDVVLYMLLDCSGSMADIIVVGDIPTTKYTPACEATCLLMGVAKKLNIPAAVTGFNDQLKVVHYPVLKFDGSGSGRIAIDGSNRDGFSIRVATGEILTRPEKRKIIIVISDGLPNYQNHGCSLSRKECYRDTALAVREAAKKGVGVIGIHIGDLKNLPWVQKIYPYFIHLEKIEHLPKLMARVLKKVILEEGF